MATELQATTELQMTVGLQVTAEVQVAVGLQVTVEVQMTVGILASSTWKSKNPPSELLLGLHESHTLSNGLKCGAWPFLRFYLVIFSLYLSISWVLTHMFMKAHLEVWSAALETWRSGSLSRCC